MLFVGFGVVFVYGIRKPFSPRIRPVSWSLASGAARSFGGSGSAGAIASLVGSVSDVPWSPDVSCSFSGRRDVNRARNFQGDAIVDQPRILAPTGNQLCSVEVAGFYIVTTGMRIKRGSDAYAAPHSLPAASLPEAYAAFCFLLPIEEGLPSHRSQLQEL